MVAQPRRPAGAAVLRFSWTVVLAALPLFVLLGLRFWHLRSDNRAWAELAQAGQWLTQGDVCDGAQSVVAANEDRQRWTAAVALARSSRVPLSPVHQARLKDMAAALSSARQDAIVVSSVRARCANVAALGQSLLEAAVHAGVDPATRSYRPEEMALRDLTVYGCLWLLLVLLLTLRLRRAVDQPWEAMARLLGRVSDGDLDIPQQVKGTGELPALLAAGLAQFQDERWLLQDKLGEGQQLIRRVIELVDAPVLVLSVNGVVDYVNAPAAAAFGSDASSLQNRELKTIVGGRRLLEAMHHALECGRSRDQTEVIAEEQDYLARSALVHNGDGEATRVVMVLSPKDPAMSGGPEATEPSAWWQRLWGG